MVAECSFIYLKKKLSSSLGKVMEWDGSCNRKICKWYVTHSQVMNSLHFRLGDAESVINDLCTYTNNV